MPYDSHFIVSDSAAAFDGYNTRDIWAPNVASAAEAYDTHGVLSLTGPSATAVVRTAINLYDVTMSDGRTLTVRAF